MAAARKFGPVVAWLREARGHLDAGRGAEALTLLLQAWEKARLPELTSLIERVDAKLTVTLLPALTDQQRRYLAWCRRARLKRAADVGPLLAELIELTEQEKTRHHFIRGRVRVLRSFPPDPRIGHFASALLGLTFPENDLVQLAKKHVDPTRALVDHELREAQLRVGVKAELPPELVTVLDGLERAVDEAELQPVGELPDEAPGFESESALLAAVYANPGDDALRQIYADRLVERGEPHGEFITLQFQRASESISPEGLRREHRLLKKHRTDWLGPLAPFVVKSTVEFAKGFPSVVSCNVKRIYQARQAFDFAEWATVKEIQFDKIAFVTAAMKSLELAINVGAFGIETLMKLEVLPRLKGLTLHPSSSQSAGEPKAWGWVKLLSRFTSLKTLMVILPWTRRASAPSIVEAIRATLPQSVTDLSLTRLANPLADGFERNQAIEEGLLLAPLQVRRFELEGFVFEKIDGAWQRAHRRRPG